jgi:hypothetical protein
MAIIIPIGVDTSGLRALNQAGGRLRSFGKIAALAAGAAGIGAMVKTLQVGTAEFMEQQKVAAQTGAVLKSTGGIANVTAKQIGSLSTALMKKSGVDDEAIASGQNLLLTFTKIRNETGKGNDIFDQATVAMLDLSVAMGKDLNSSAILVGKALNDPVKGATALSRAGVQLTKGQKDQIEAFVESGRVLEAQKIILAELTTQFGGSAEAAGKTLPGQLNILKQTFNNLAGEIAAKFLPGLATAATKLVGFLNQFGKQPTLEAKVRFVIDKFGDLVWSGAQTIANWWNKPKVQFEDNPANRLKVSIAPAGRDQANAFARDLSRKLNEAVTTFGFQLGYQLTTTIFGGARRGATQQGEQAGNFIVRSILVNTAGLELGKRLVVSLFNGVKAGLAEVDLGGILREWARSNIEIAGGVGVMLGKELVKGLAKAAGRRGAGGGLANVMTQTIRDAVQSARGALAGAAGTLGGMVGQVIMGSSPEAKRAREIRAQQKKELAQREETRLRNAVAQAETDEERKAAEQDLQDFILEQEAQRLEESAQVQAEKANNDIANLTESFNRGEISAQQFSDALNGIIGANRGAELGAAFAGAFERELQGILNIARDIASVVGQGQPIAAVSGGGVGEALKSENERRFREALDAWEKRRKARRDQAVNFRKRPGSDEGSTITAAEEKEIRDIMAAWDKENRKPVRADFGLALGGILKQPTFVAGEAGKEAVIPLESGSAMRILRDAIGGGGGSTQVINLTVNAGLGTNPDELSQVIVNSIKRYEKRNGAVFQGPIVSVAANAAGVTSTDSGATTFNRVRSLRSG